jgi:hypothetical protein
MNLDGKQFLQLLRYSFTSYPYHSHIFCVVYSSSSSSSSCTGKHKCEEMNKYRPKNEERINSKCKNLYTSTFGSDGKHAEASSRKQAFAHVICIVFRSHPHIFENSPPPASKQYIQDQEDKRMKHHRKQGKVKINKKIHTCTT